MVALEHLKELDKQLKEDGVPFSPEASLHLAEMTAAISELEADRRAAHEHLEVETIENSKLRQQIHNTRERMSQEILADIAAARASNAEEIEQLREELDAVSRLQEAAAKRQEAISARNEALCPERERSKAEHEGLVASLNEQITLKYGLQTQLDETLGRIEEMESCTAAAEQDKATLQQDMALEREAFALRKDDLSGEGDRVEGGIEEQKQAIERSKKELDEVNDKKRETQERLGELVTHMAKLESDLRRVTAARCQYEKQREGETQKHQELRQQTETLKKDLRELGEAFSVTVRRLKEEIATVEGKIGEGHASRLVYQDALAQIYEIFKHQRDEEEDVTAEHFKVSQKLGRSKLQLEERIASIVRHSKEIKEMDKQITELRETNTVNQRVFERNQEEMCDNVGTEKRNINQLEEEKRRLGTLLEELRRKQEEHVEKMTSDIGSARERYEELRQEEAALRQRQPKSTDAALMKSHITECEVEYRQQETKHHQDIEQCTADTESVTRSNEEKQREVEEKEATLKEVEAKWDEEQPRNQRLKTLTSELKRKRYDLEQSIRGLKEKTGSLLRPKEEAKAELEEMRGSHMDTLGKQASELRAAELSVYDTRVKLEQVSMENSRLHLSIRQMTEGLGRAREDKERCRRETIQFQREAKALFESLQEAWREDFSIARDSQSRDGDLLALMGALMGRLEGRRQQIRNVSTLVHRQMLQFSKRLGESIEQRS